MKQLCPVCAKNAVGCSGESNSSILIVLSHPDWADVMYGYPFAVDKRTNKTTSGFVMRTECFKQGFDLNSARCCCLWLHDDMTNEQCFEVGKDMVLEEAKGRKAILLVGAQAVRYFTGYSVEDVNGLSVTSGLLSCPIIYPLVSPASVLIKGAGVGEIRFGLTEFTNRLREEHIL